MRGRPGCLRQSAEGEADRTLLASVLLSMRISDNQITSTSKLSHINNKAQPQLLNCQQVRYTASLIDY